ncbi:MAG: C25 family cysteine peptidase, partial [Porticoccaceae bacterium]
QVQSQALAGRFSVQFSSASEVANVGYSIEEMVDGELKPLTRHLLASAAIDSAEVNEYRLELDRLPASGNFYIVDHDTKGARALRGPFLVGASYGEKPVLTVPDWPRVRAETAQAAAREAALAVDNRAAKLWVGEPGFYRVSAAMLAAAGIDLDGVPVADIAITFRGQGVPRRVNAADKTFAAESSIDFLVRPGYSLYSAELPYLLRADGVGVVAIMSEPRSASVLRPAWYWASARYAPDRLYNIGAPGNDPWQADRLLAFSTQAATVDLSLGTSAVASTEFAARLSAELIGVTNWPGAGQDHHIQLNVNGSPRGDARFDGGRAETVSVLLPELANGSQAIRLIADGQTGFDFDLINLESVELQYPRLPVASAGRLYMQRTNADSGDGVSTGGDDLGDASFAADFEGEFTPPGFAASGFADGELLAYAGSGDDWRRLDAVQTANGGVATVPLLAAASDYFIANVAAVPAPRIEAVPLAEDLLSGSADYLIISHAAFLDAMAPLVELQQSRGLSTRVVDIAQVFLQFGDGLPEGTAIRRYLKAAVAGMGLRYVLLVGADTYDYKDFLGLGSVSLVPTLYQSLGNGIRYAPTDNALADFDDDGVPELAIGRLPVRTLAEFTALRDKLASIQGSRPGRRLLLVASGSDAESDFRAISEDFAARLPGDWNTNRAYVDDLGVPGASNALQGQLNSGAGLVSYVGHSAPIQWSSADQVLLTASQISVMTGAVSDLIVQWGCWNSYFVSPRADTMAHAFLLPANHGAAAVIGVSTLTEVEAHQALGDVLYPQLAPGTRIGDALLAAKQSLAGQQGIIRDILLASALLGDPAMPVR